MRSELDGDEQRLYELIWMRTIACQMVDARGRKVTIRLGATSTAGEQATFRAAGKTYDFLGWRRAYIEDVDEDDEVEREARLPSVAEGDGGRRAPSSRPSATRPSRRRATPKRAS